MYRKPLMMVLIVALGILLIYSIPRLNGSKEYIYDNDARIIQPADSYSFSERMGRTIGNQLSVSFADFTGKQTIWMIAAGQDSVLELNMMNDIKKGKFKVCLIDPSRKVKIISEGSHSGIANLEVRSGENVLVIVGSGAAGEIDMTLRYDARVSIIPYEQLLR